MSVMTPYLMAYVIMMVIYRLMEITMMKGLKSRFFGSRSKDHTYYVIAVPFMLTIVEIPLEHVLTGHRPAPIFFYGGMGLFIVATIFRIKGLIDLKGGFSPYIEKQANHVLVTTGVYYIVRHPLYLSMLLLVIAAAVMLTAVWAWVFILITLAGILNRIRAEEKFLLEQFPEYQAYCEKTWRLIPWIY